MEKRYLYFYQKLTIAGSLVCIIFFGLAAFEENFLREWKNYQREFRDILLAEAETDTERETAQDFPIEIRQVILEDFDRVDRCISCHTGIDNPAMADQPQPFRAHSGNYTRNHPVEKFGCSICHGGQDRALGTKEVFAREHDVHWKYPVIPVQYVQSSCGRCHVPLFDSGQKLEGADVLIRGRKIFLREGCLSCHNVRGTGGVTSVELTDQGKKTENGYSFEFVSGEHSVTNWLERHFADPQTVSPGSIMPKKNLSDAEMTALVTFTMSLFYPDFSTDFYSLDLIKEFKGGRKPLSGESAWKILCSSCHGANGTSSVYREFERFVPALNNREFLAAASREMIAFTVRNGRGGIYMSPWAHDNGGLSDAEIESVVDYIENWKKQPPSFSDVRSTPADRVLGRTLFRSRCGTCHGMDGEGGIGPSLNNQDFLSLVSDEFLYTTIVLGRRNTAMVSWSFLSRREIAGIIGYLRSWQKTPRVHLSRRRIDGNEIEGKALYMGMCAGCHGLHGEGAVGPALFNRDFLAAASDQFILSSMRRGRSRSPMLSFAREFQGIGNLTQQEMNDITAYIRSRENDTTDIIYSTISPGTPSRGKTLYEGMCAGCHGTNGEGKHGPALNNQEFLNAATNGFLQATIALGRGGTAMRSWAKGAQGYGEMSAEDINDIVAYIRTWQKIVIPIE